jgi:site-specific recombinase XerD
MGVGEVAVLQLDDIDWRAGEIVVRGKGKCTERLPVQSNCGISAQHFGRSRNVLVSFSQSSQPADLAIACDRAERGEVPYYEDTALTSPPLRFTASAFTWWLP